MFSGGRVDSQGGRLPCGPPPHVTGRVTLTGRVTCDRSCDM